MAEERSRDRSSPAESQPKFPGCSHFRRRNDNHFRCQQCRLNEGQSLCTQDSPCLVCKAWLPEAWVAQAKANAQINRRKAAAAAKAAKKAEETVEESVEIHTPEEAIQLPSKRSTSKGSSKTKRTKTKATSSESSQPKSVASRVSAVGRPSSHGSDRRRSRSPERKRRHVGTTNVRILRDISRHGVTAPVERESGPGQVPLAVPALGGGVPSPAVSPRRQTPVRRPLPLDIIIILRAIVDPFHQVHLGHLPTAGLRPVTREDERVPTGRVRRTSPDGMSSCPPRVPSRLRRERSWWSLRRPGRFMLNRPQKFQSRHRWRTARWQTARQVPTRQQATAWTQVAARQHATARPQATALPQVTVRIQVTAQPQGSGRPQWMTQPVTTQQMSQKSELQFNEPDETDGPAPLPTESRLGTPAATSPGDGPDVSRSTGTSSLLFPSIPRSINQETLVDFMSMWTLLQRLMDQSSVPVAPAYPPDQSAAPAPRHDSTNRRSVTPARSPERRPKSPERFLHTPLSTVSSFLRRASCREPERKARTPVRQARTPVRHRSESRESRSRSPLSRS